jgi:putative glutamine amidotransferase
MTTPRIGVTGVVRSVQDADRTGVNAAYVHAVLVGGGLPVILSPILGASAAPRVLDGLEGLVLSGGEDVHPSLYGADPHPSLELVDPRRDAFELALVKVALERNMPVLAICRGLQVVNVALGGTLWQHLPGDLPETLGHRQDAARAARTHPVTVAPGTRLQQALGKTELEVNSFHHQAIRTLAPGLRTVALAPDGVIEAVELELDQTWMLAVQWHPEEFYADPKAPDMNLFRALAKEAGGGLTADSPKERTPARSPR